MKINKVTITGADDDISSSSLNELSDKFPFVEWAILFSDARAGTERYPTRQKVKELTYKRDFFSAHLCGKLTRNVLEKGDFSLMDNLKSTFKRFQLNYNFDKSNGWNTANVLTYAFNNPDISIIFQYNKSNSKYLNPILNESPENIHFLYDSSGGRGSEIKTIEDPFKNYTGYSGGISNKNVEDIIKKILNHSSETEVWIDMESGVRTDNKLDLKKVTEVLEISSKFVI